MDWESLTGCYKISEDCGYYLHEVEQVTVESETGKENCQCD